MTREGQTGSQMELGGSQLGWPLEPSLALGGCEGQEVMMGEGAEASP